MAAGYSKGQSLTDSLIAGGFIRCLASAHPEPEPDLDPRVPLSATFLPLDPVSSAEHSAVQRIPP